MEGKVLLLHKKRQGKSLLMSWRVQQEHHEQILVLFTTLLLYLSWGENHVHSASTGSKSTLAFRDDVAAVHVSV